MARKIRVQYPGAIYHAMNRGDRREAIFNGDNDRLLFLETLAEACDKTDWQIQPSQYSLLILPGSPTWPFGAPFHYQISREFDPVISSADSGSAPLRHNHSFPVRRLLLI